MKYIERSVIGLCGLAVILMVMHTPRANAQALGSPVDIAGAPIIGPTVGLLSSLGGAAENGDAGGAFQSVLSPVNGTSGLLSDVEAVLPTVLAEPLPGLGTGGSVSDPITDPIVNNIKVLEIANFLNPILIEANPLLTSIPVVGAGGGDAQEAGAAVFYTAEAVLASDLTGLLAAFPDSNPLTLILLQFENTLLQPITGGVSDLSTGAIDALIIPLLDNLSGGLNTLAPAFGSAGDALSTGDTFALPGLSAGSAPEASSAEAAPAASVAAAEPAFVGENP